MATKPEISWTLTDSVEIPTQNSGFSMMTSSIKDEPNDCDNDRLPKVASLAPKTSLLPFPVVARCRNRPGSVSSRWAWSKTPDFPLELSFYLSIWHSFRHVSTSGFDGHIAISGYPSISHLFVDTFFEFGVVDNFVYRYRITVILTSDLFGCMSLWLWLCSRWRPITTSGFVRHLENVQKPLFTLLPTHLTIFSL